MATDVANISEERVASVTRVPDLADALYAECERACAAGKLLAAPVGLAAVERELGEYWPPGLHVLHAGPGADKTAFAVRATVAQPARLRLGRTGTLIERRRRRRSLSSVRLGSERVGLRPRALVPPTAPDSLALADVLALHLEDAHVQIRMLDTCADLLARNLDNVLDRITQLEDRCAALAEAYATPPPQPAVRNLNVPQARIAKLEGRLQAPSEVSAPSSVTELQSANARIARLEERATLQNRPPGVSQPAVAALDTKPHKAPTGTSVPLPVPVAAAKRAPRPPTEQTFSDMTAFCAAVVVAGRRGNAS